MPCIHCKIWRIIGGIDIYHGCMVPRQSNCALQTYVYEPVVNVQGKSEMQHVVMFGRNSSSDRTIAISQPDDHCAQVFIKELRLFSNRAFSSHGLFAFRELWQQKVKKEKTQQ